MSKKEKSIFLSESYTSYLLALAMDAGVASADAYKALQTVDAAMPDYDDWCDGMSSAKDLRCQFVFGALHMSEQYGTSSSHLVKSAAEKLLAEDVPKRWGDRMNGIYFFLELDGLARSTEVNENTLVEQANKKNFNSPMLQPFSAGFLYLQSIGGNVSEWCQLFAKLFAELD